MAGSPFIHDEKSYGLYMDLPRKAKKMVSPVANALAEQYDFDPETLSLFGSAGRRSLHLILIQAGVSGIDLVPGSLQNERERSWRGIFPEDLLNGKKRFEAVVPDRFSLIVNEEAYDTRLAMMPNVYACMVMRALRQRRLLPDAPPADISDIHSWTWTLQTGVSRLRDCALISCTDLDKSVLKTGTPLTNGLPNVRFRPGAVIDLSSVK